MRTIGKIQILIIERKKLLSPGIGGKKGSDILILFADPPKVGRPPKDDKRNHHLGVRLSDWEIEKLKDLAAHANMSVGEYVREHIFKEVEHDTENR